MAVRSRLAATLDPLKVEAREITGASALPVGQVALVGDVVISQIYAEQSGNSAAAALASQNAAATSATNAAASAAAALASQNAAATSATNASGSAAAASGSAAAASTSASDASGFASTASSQATTATVQASAAAASAGNALASQNAAATSASNAAASAAAAAADAAALVGSSAALHKKLEMYVSAVLDRVRSVEIRAEALENQIDFETAAPVGAGVGSVVSSGSATNVGTTPTSIGAVSFTATGEIAVLHGAIQFINGTGAEQGVIARLRGNSTSGPELLNYVAVGRTASLGLAPLRLTGLTPGTSYTMEILARQTSSTAGLTVEGTLSVIGHKA